MNIVVRRLRLTPGHRFPRHAHQAWSFGLMADGAVRLWRRGSWHPAGPTHATVLHPGEVHEGVVHMDADLRYTAVSVPEHLVSSLSGSARAPSFTDLLQPAAPVSHLVAAISARVLEERRERTLAALTTIFGQARALADPDRANRSRRLAAAAKRHLDDHFTEPVRIPALAGDLDVAPATLIREFRRQYNLAPYAYVISRRVDLARRLLDAGASPAEAAGRAGFYDQSHLNRHFTRLVGVTPGSYRQA